MRRRSVRTEIGQWNLRLRCRANNATVQPVVLYPKRSGSRRSSPRDAGIRDARSSFWSSGTSAIKQGVRLMDAQITPHPRVDRPGSCSGALCHFRDRPTAGNQEDSLEPPVGTNVRGALQGMGQAPPIVGIKTMIRCSVCSLHNGKQSAKSWPCENFWLPT